MLEGWFIVNCKLVFVPVAGVLPVPVQPVHTFRVIMDSCIGEVIASFMFEPASNQPLAGR